MERGQRGEQRVLVGYGDRLVDIGQEMVAEVVHQQASVAAVSGEGAVGAPENLPDAGERGLREEGGLATDGIPAAPFDPVQRGRGPLEHERPTTARREAEIKPLQGVPRIGVPEGDQGGALD